MPDNWIPRLENLCFSKNGYRVPSGFAQKFVKVHGEEWGIAEEHWEMIVERVLNTDAVQPHASKNEAVHQAVAAAALLLDRSDLHDRCPLCPSAGVTTSTPLQRKWKRWLRW